MYHFRSNLYFPCLLFFDKFFSIVVDVSQATFAAILTIEMGSHEDTSSTFFCGAFSSQAMNFSIVINSVVCKGCHIYSYERVLLSLGWCNSSSFVFWHHHEDARPSVVLIPFECCNRKESFHLPIVFRQISNVADREEFPPYLESLP